MAVTQQQIADRLKISRSWVARALSDNERVPHDMRVRVQATAQEMGYDVNKAARSLIAQRYGTRLKTGIIAVVFPPMIVPAPQTMPFFYPFLRGMEEKAAFFGIDILTLTTRRGELPRIVRERGVDGLVTIGFLPDNVEEMRALGLPVITYHAHYQNAHSIMVDDREGTRLATRHLLSLGHRNIAFLGVERVGDIGLSDTLRQEGYEAALAEFGVPVNPYWINVDLPLPDTSSYKYCTGCTRCAACIGWQTLKKQAGAEGRPPFTAVVCHHDVIAMGVIDQAKADGLMVPQDLSVVGFDDISNQYHFEPHVTSVSFSREEMGRYAIELLHDQEDRSDDSDHYEHKVFPVKLVVRQSTAPPPALAGKRVN